MITVDSARLPKAAPVVGVMAAEAIVDLMARRRSFWLKCRSGSLPFGLGAVQAHYAHGPASLSPTTQPTSVACWLFW